MCLAVPGKIESLTDDGKPMSRKGKVSFGGVLRDVNLSCVPDAKVGDYVIVHVGIALSRIDEEEARKTLDLFDEVEAAVQQK